MSHDPYSPCICGSGKKLKFCCQDILTDMQRIKRLLDNQPDAAEKMLHNLYAAHPDKAVLVTELAELKRDQDQEDKAFDLCVEFLRRHPDEPRVLLCLADLSLKRDGFESSRRIIHRALQLAGPEHSARVAMMLGSIGGAMMQTGRPASAFAHVALAARHAPSEMKAQILSMLGSLVAESSAAWPFLGPLQLLPTGLAGESADADQRARRLSELGCWEPSAILYSRITQTEPDNGAVRHNLGISQLQDGHPREAAESLHRAAGLIDDFDMAAETETLACLLDLDHSEDRDSIIQRSCRVPASSQLQEQLQRDRRVVRAPNESNDAPDKSSIQRFRLLEDTKPLPEGGQLFLASILLAGDAEEGSSGDTLLSLTARDSDMDSAWQVFRSIADACIADDVEPDDTVVESRPSCFANFDRWVHYDPPVSTEANRKQTRAWFQNCLQKWMKTPQAQLNGLSPVQSAEDPERRLQTSAAFLTLQAICRRIDHHESLDEIRQALGVPEPGRIRLDSGQSINSVPLLLCLRLALDELTDRQVLQLVNRTAMARDIRLMERALDELISRPEALEVFSPRRAHLLRASIARYDGSKDVLDEAFEAARSTAENDSDAFRVRLELDLKELSFRLDDPDDPRIPQLLQVLSDEYFVKVPEIAEVVREELTRTGCEHLLSEVEPTVEIAVSPELQDKPASKLWLPWQD